MKETQSKSIQELEIIYPEFKEKTMANTFRNGQVKIANDILDQLAIIACKEIYGVHSSDESTNKINLQNTNPKAAVSFLEDKLNIDLTVYLDKNVNVRKTVKDIQENVVRIIETMTGLSVARVNVNIPKLEI